jgi:N-acyl-D-amino-acid deacylase
VRYGSLVALTLPRRFRAVAAAALLITAASLARTTAQEQTAQAPFDLVIANGRVVDGTGAPWFVGDVGIRGDRIAAIGRLRGVTATVAIDATGMVVAPGFVDPHVHARERIFAIPTAEGYLLQGLTTVVDGNDGSSPLPLGPWFEKVQATTVSPNVAAFVGQGTVREAVMGTANRKATAAEIARMQALVAQAMEDGAMGLSTGLAYVPGAFTPTDEIVALATTAREHGGIRSATTRSAAVSSSGRASSRSSSSGRRGRAASTSPSISIPTPRRRPD